MLRSDIDLFNPDTYSNGYPADLFRPLRQSGKLYWHVSAVERRGYWIVTTAAHADLIQQNPLVFSSEIETTAISTPPHVDLEDRRRFLVNMDPPRHGRYRKAINRILNSDASTTSRMNVPKIADVLLGEMTSRDDCDFVELFSSALPVRFLMEMLHIDVEHFQQLRSSLEALVHYQEPELRRSDMDMKFAATHLWHHGLTLFHDRASRECSGVDLHSSVDTETSLNAQDFCYAVSQILIAGYETTRNLLGHAARLLLDHPEQLDALRANTNLIESATDEIHRFEPSNYQVLRTAVEDVSIADTTIRKGDRIALIQHSINRDEQLNQRSEEFDVTRASVRHRTFGSGPHTCPGISFARLELRSLLSLLVSFYEMRATSPCLRLKSRNTNGLRELRVSVRPR
jgi:cholest-4-en-3-one 26-monooxygenase